MSGNRYFVGVGVGDYDDASLNLLHAVSDVERVSNWFVADSGVQHIHELTHLGANPTWTTIVDGLQDFLAQRDEDDVVVIWFACHGDFQGNRVYLFGRDTPPSGLAGRAVDADTIGQIIGQSQPHNVLVVIDACVAGKLGTVIQRAAEDVADEMNTRRPHKYYSQAVIASAYARDPAHDGLFADAFLQVVSQEQWTGTSSEWISIDQLIDGLNKVLRDLELPQVADRRVWGPGVAELIPNPNFASRNLVGLGPDAGFAPQSEPTPGEQGSFFTGRAAELTTLASWLAADNAPPQPPMMVITGSPGSGKSALLAQLVSLAGRDPGPGSPDPDPTLPPAGSIDGVLLCHNKTARQMIEDLAAAMGGAANDLGGLLEIAANGSFTIAVDSLDEAAGDDASVIAEEILRPLAEQRAVRFIVATRRRAVHGSEAVTSLLDHLLVPAGGLIDLDLSPSRGQDIRQYVHKRLEAAGTEPARAKTLASSIAVAADPSFLVAALAAGNAQLHQDSDEGYVLPSSVGEALAGYIDRMPDPAKARDLLRPLAWARGSGLPWGTLWPSLAGRLAGALDPARPQPVYDHADVAELLDHGGDLIVETSDSTPVYRLFHEALAEHLRSDCDPVQAYDVIAEAMLDDRGRIPWLSVDRYTTQNLPAVLRGAGRLQDAVDVLLDPSWERALRETTKDPLAAADDVDETVGLLLQADPDDLRVVPLCHVHSQNLSPAPPLIVDVIARSGQTSRASVLANNLTAANDRLLAYQLLAQVYADQGNFAGARASARQVKLAVAAMPPTHRSMAWFRLTKAYAAARQPARAERSARAALEVALNLDGDGWDVHNALFWAGCAARDVGDEASLQKIRERLDADAASGAILFRNQTLQAAAVSGHAAFLRDRTDEWRRSRAHAGPIRDGNLALALADAGMEAELDEAIGLITESRENQEADAEKRWAWALAMRGHLDDATTVAEGIPIPTERLKAIMRVAEVARARGAATELLDRLADSAMQHAQMPSPRSQARVVRILWQAGRAEEAMTLAEEVMASAHEQPNLLDPRDAEEAPAPALRSSMGAGAAKRAAPRPVKTGRRELVSSTVPVEDAQRSREVVRLAESGALVAAEGLAREVTVPLYRATAYAAIARHGTVPELQLRAWLRALTSARTAGRTVVLKMESEVVEHLKDLTRSDEAEALESRLAELDVKWEVERFAEQYATLRSTLASGVKRTERMTTLLVAPRVSAVTSTWRKQDLISTWGTGDVGRRLFVIGLIQGNPSLAVPDILVEGIRDSRSAFEQYHTLKAALECDLFGEDARAVRQAVHDEVTGVPRPDGTEARIGPQTNRTGMARRLLERLAP